MLLRTCGTAANLGSSGTLPRKDPSAGVISLIIQALLYKALNLPPLLSTPNLRLSLAEGGNGCGREASAVSATPDSVPLWRVNYSRASNPYAC